MGKFDVTLSSEHLKRFSKVSPMRALQQIIWNSFDADSARVEVVFDHQQGPAGDLISKITVSDNGRGMAYDSIERNLCLFGQSDKSRADKSPGGRYYHGKLGEGRYTYFSLGGKISWTSTFRDNKDKKTKRFTVLFGDGFDKSFTASDPTPCDGDPGMTVEITQIPPEVSGRLLSKEGASSSLCREFFPYLMAYAPISLVYDGEKIDPEKSIAGKKEDSFSVSGSDFAVRIVEWEGKSPSSDVYLCGSGLIPYRIVQLASELNVSAYVSSPFFDEAQNDGTILAYEETADGPAIKEGIANSIDRFVKERAEQKKNSFVSTLKNEGVYPYVGEAYEPSDRCKRKIFDAVASEMSSLAPKTLLNADKKTKELTWRLVAESIETNPSNLHTILGEVFKLSKEKQDEFAALLSKTTLNNIISASSEIASRLSFIEELTAIIYGDAGSHVKERTEFQPLLLSQAWVFGDRYRYGVDDVNLRNVLKAYIRDLGRDDIALTDDDRRNADLSKIPDMVFWCNNSFGEAFENLVVEIKRPHKKLGEPEMSQIKHYAYHIAGDDRFFATKGTTWRFILIGEGLEDFTKNELKGKADGVIAGGDGEKFKVQVMCWSELLDSLRKRYDYIKKDLDLKMSDETVKKSLEKRCEEIKQAGI